MKALLLLALLVVTASVVDAAAKKLHKKASSETEKKHMIELEEKLEQLLELEAEVESEMDELEEEEEEAVEPSDEENEVIPVDEEEGQGQEEEYLPEDEDNNFHIEDINFFYGDPCREMYCGAGRMCVVNDNGEGECRCVNTCDTEPDVRRRVCSNHNETWMSDCELYRQRCLCQEEDASCLKPDYSHVHIDYYGECQDTPVCEPDELEDFPRRMSEWLFNIMRDLADRQTLSNHYIRLEREAEENPTKQWTYAVVWKWCELDSHPKDSAVSRHELFPIRAPLFTLEHCIGTFLDSCDLDDDHLISLKEWGNCTKLSEEDTDQLKALCEDIHDNE